ncbi:MAG: amino acid permease [Cyclobacteriaceae bacterium]|nr:amino acid permease [Cyclobacteriaceae bacterium]
MRELANAKAKFGTAPVYFTAISTILGAIMFLRFGYAVGNVGFAGTLLIILFGHMVTIPTGMAIAEIATNQRVRGGGEYYIMSRSFGINIGASIGIALYLSQAISVAFYLIAFAEAFDPLLSWLQSHYHIVIADKRLISMPALVIVGVLMLTKGANLGVTTLYVVVATLFLSLISFFLGNPVDTVPEGGFSFFSTVKDPDGFFKVFAICFPAFTGMTAGVGLSGDLKNPQRSIPIGTLAATITGLVIYAFIAYKLAVSATPEDLNSDQLVMQRIAAWGPIIPIGLAAATVSSALGSIMVAPRTLQALSADKVFPSKALNKWLSKERGSNSEPFNATLLTVVIAAVFIAMGSVDSVASVISMFFMVTYGAICVISFLQHFASDPAYRPDFKSKWYISLMGFLLTNYLMFKMHPGYAVLSIIVMVILYFMVANTRQRFTGVAKVFQGVIFQINRKLQVFIQATDKDNDNWRPSVICISPDFFKRPTAFTLMRWISHRSGFGTYLHYIEGYLSKETNREARETLSRLIKLSGVSGSNVFLDTLISPSFTSAVAQAIQLPSVSGKETNTILFEYSRDSPDFLPAVIQNLSLVKATDYDVCVLSSTQKNFGIMNSIHIWITPNDLDNAGLMILLGYIILGHPDWKKGILKITAIFPEHDISEYEKNLKEMIKVGRLPVSPHNIELIEQLEDVSVRDVVVQKSKDDDLIVLGFGYERLKQQGDEFFTGYEGIGNILFVHAAKERAIDTYD